MGPTASGFVPYYSANGIRTRVWALRGPRPSPLDDSAVTPQARQDSNLQPPVLETGALPLELRTSEPASTRGSALMVTGTYQGG